MRGTEAGLMQNVGYMQVIPLVSDLDDERFVSPDQALVGTNSYGSMAFENPSNRILVVPLHAGYVVSKAAQNHAMAHAGLVKAKGSRTFNTAMCIQQSQGGLINKDKYRLSILPHSLREFALGKRKERSYQKLWGQIGQFNAKFGLNQRGHLEDFLNRFEKELNEFVAEFECIPNQIGAIVLIDGRVVGIERAPSRAYFRSVWEALIRECYGSLAIEYRHAMGDKAAPPKVRFAMRREGVISLDDVRAALKEVKEAEEAAAKASIRELLDEPFEVEKEESLNDLSLETVGNAQFKGQIIRDKESFVTYASLFASQSWIQTSKRSAASAFSI